MMEPMACTFSHVRFENLQCGHIHTLPMIITVHANPFNSNHPSSIFNQAHSICMQFKSNANRTQNIDCVFPAFALSINNK